MNSQITETVGFLSRWALLALAAGMLLTTAVLMGSSVSELGQGPQLELVIPDALVSQDLRYAVRGRSIPRVKSLAIRGIVSDRQGRLQIAWSGTDGYCYLGGKAVDLGVVRRKYAPLPFGRLALTSASPQVRTIPAEAPVTLVDTRLLGSSPEDIGRGAQRWNEVLSGETTLAYVFLGELNAYNAARRALRQVSDAPLLMNVRSPGEWKAGFAYALKYVRRTPRSHIRVITADAGVAMWAARKGCRVHMIGPSGSIVSPPKNLRLHSDMQMFGESLSEGAMNQ